MSIHWILCFVFLMITPVLTIAAGILRGKGLKTIGQKGGYNTLLSVSSQEAWNIAQALCGKRYVIFGIVMAVLSGIILFAVPDSNTLNLYIFTGMLLLVQGLFEILLISSVEMALRARYQAKPAD